MKRLDEHEQSAVDRLRQATIGRGQTVRVERWDVVMVLNALTTRITQHQVPNRGHVGEANPRARLTEADVRALRDARAAGATAEELAFVFGVTIAHVYKILARGAWKHVE